MDAWNPDQLRRMQLGGNDRLNKFLAQYGVAKHTEIRDKYNSKAAGGCCAAGPDTQQGLVGKPCSPPLQNGRGVAAGPDRTRRFKAGRRRERRRSDVLAATWRSLPGVR